MDNSAMRFEKVKIVPKQKETMQIKATYSKREQRGLLRLVLTAMQLRILYSIAWSAKFVLDMTEKRANKLFNQ